MKLLILGLAAPAPPEGSAEVIPVPGFGGLPPQLGLYRPDWRSVIASLAFHVAAVNLIPVLDRLLPSGREDLRNVQVASVEPLRLRVPLYAPRPAPRAGGGRKKLGAPPKPGASGGERPAPARRAFQLPPTPKPSPRDQTLLQLSSPPDVQVPADLRLPQVMFWSQTPARAPRMPAKKFVMPGRASQAARPAELAAAPKLEAPNVEVRITDLKVASAQAPKLNPALPVPPGTPMPVRTQPEAAQRADAPPAVNAEEGEAINVLALNPNPALWTETIVVPPGNQISAQHAPSGQGEPGGGTGSGGGENGKGTGTAKQGAGASGGTGSGKGSGAGGGGAAGSGSGSGTGREGGSGGGGTGPGGSGTGSGGGGGGSGRATGTGPGGGSGGTGNGGGTARDAGVAIQLPAAAIILPPTGVPIRIVHPDNSVFDVVVQSAGGDQLVQAGGVLTGRPVYTVYLRVGAPKDWILHYCVPRQATRNTGPVIQLGSPSPLKAPYPRLTLIPRPEEMASKGRAFLRGYLTEKGQFRDLAAVRTEDDQITKQLIPYLGKWEFRPATRDGKPVEVEFLLVIPPAGS